MNETKSEGFDPNSYDAVLASLVNEVKNLKGLVVEIRNNQLEDRRQLEVRVTRIEEQQWYQRGIAAAVGVFATVIWNYITGK